MKKRITGILLAVTICLMLLPMGAMAATGVPLPQSFIVNGKPLAVDVYSINGTNYFRLRDLATALSGTERQFEVDWDGSTITLTSGRPYTPNGTETNGKGMEERQAQISNVKVVINGKAVDFVAYNINGSNYFRLHDIGLRLNLVFNFNPVQNAVIVDTGKGFDVGSDLSEEEVITLVDKNLDIIIAGVPETYPIQIEHENELIYAHPYEFSAIVALGESALPYLKEILYHENLVRRLMALAAIYAINPELYDLEFVSPDGKYSVKCSVYSFRNSIQSIIGTDYFNIRIVECATDSVIIALDDIKNNIGVDWSPDSRYAAISSGIPRYYIETGVFDILNADFICLPSAEEIKNTLKEDIPYVLDDTRLNSARFFIREWITKDVIKISIAFVYSAGEEILGGWYTYDLTEKSIVDIEWSL